MAILHPKVDPPPALRVEITMRRGENIRVFDAKTKEEISANVHRIAIAPLGTVSLVELIIFKRDAKGDLIWDHSLDGPAVEHRAGELVYLRGDWEARS